MKLKSVPKTQDSKSISKRKNNAGTFNIDNPKKMKKDANHLIKEERKKKKKGNLLAGEDGNFEAIPRLFKKKRSASNSLSNDLEDHESKKAKISSEEETQNVKKVSKDLKHNKSKIQSKKFSPKNLKKGQSESEKPNWNTFKEQKKALRDKRRAAEYEGDTYDVSIKARKKLEGIRSKNCSKDVQVKELSALHSMLKGKLLSVVYAHDMSRVIQTMLKLAHKHKQTNILKDMMSELIEDIKGMCKRKYSIHVARAIIDSAPEAERSQILKAFQGSVMKLLTHSVGSTALKHLYSKLKPNERLELQKELYGGTAKLVTSEPVTALDVIFKVLPNMKEQTLDNTKENLSALIDKSAVDSPMVHTVLLDYLSHSKSEDISDMLEIAREHLKALSSSKDGVHVAMMCIWMGTPKARKKIIKELKGEVANLACGEHTHLVLLAVFDCVDDTKLIEKIILPELIQEKLSELLKSTYGRKVLTYLCSRRDPRMFSAPVVAVLAQGDNNPHSKKDADVRATELQSMVVPALLSHISENASQWIDCSPNLIVLLIVLKCGSGDKLHSAMAAVAKHIVSPSESQNNVIDLSRVDGTACHSVLKKIAEHDEILSQKGLSTFGAALLEELTDKHITTWLTNNHCCFLLFTVLKHGDPETVQKLRLKIKSLSSKAWSNPQSIPVGGKKLQELL